MPKLEHIGIAVDDVETVLACFDDLLDCRPYKAETVALQDVRTHFLDASTAKLELLESLSDDSPIHNFLDRRGEGLHHLAFEVSDLDATMERLRTAGFTLLSDIPQPGADDKRIVFVHPGETHGVLVEFCETTAPDWTPTTVPHRNGELALYEQGPDDAPCLLCLHDAGGTTLLDTAPLMRRLAPAYHVVGVDLCGHGATSLPDDGRVTMAHFVDDVHAALDAVDRDSCHLFGFSLGCTVALSVADATPERVNRLALFAPNLSWADDLVDTLKSHLNLNVLRRHIPEQAERLAAQHQDPGRLFPALRAFVDTLPSAGTDDLPTAVPHPTLVTGLDDDPLFSIDATLEVYEALPEARLALLPGRRHRLTPDTVDLLAPLLRQHVATGSAA